MVKLIAELTVKKNKYYRLQKIGMRGFFKEPMKPKEALEKYNIQLPEGYSHNPFEGVKKLYFEDSKITKKQYNGFFKDTYNPLLPLLLMDLAELAAPYGTLIADLGKFFT